MAGVLIVGAGIVGLFTAYELERNGFTDYQILEAKSEIGGRVRDTGGTFDIPLDLGAQFLFEGPEDLNDLLGPDVTLDYEVISSFGGTNFQVCTMEEEQEEGEEDGEDDDEEEEEEGEDSDEEGLFGFVLNLLFGWLIALLGGGGGSDGGGTTSPIMTPTCVAASSSSFVDGAEQRFGNGKTLFTFLEEFLIDPVITTNKISLDTTVTAIDYSDPDMIMVTTENSGTLEAEVVVLAVPLSVIQRDLITLNPPLESSYVDSFDKIVLQEGLRVWLEFDAAFVFPDAFQITVEDRTTDFYGAMVGLQASNQNVLTIQQVDINVPLSQLSSDDDDIINQLLSDLEVYFEGATNAFVQGLVQNWSMEELIFGTIITIPDDEENVDPESLAFRIPLGNNRVYFAGDYTLAPTAGNGVSTAQAILEASSNDSR